MAKVIVTCPNCKVEYDELVGKCACKWKAVDPASLSPEVSNGYSDLVSQAADMFSLGGTLNLENLSKLMAKLEATAWSAPDYEISVPALGTTTPMGPNDADAINVAASIGYKVTGFREPKGGDLWLWRKAYQSGPSYTNIENVGTWALPGSERYIIERI